MACTGYLRSTSPTAPRAEAAFLEAAAFHARIPHVSILTFREKIEVDGVPAVVFAATDPKTAQAVRDEMADVLLYLVRLADVLGVDLNAAVQAKLRTNATKYPGDKARGSSAKYTEM